MNSKTGAMFLFVVLCKAKTARSGFWKSESRLLPKRVKSGSQVEQVRMTEEPKMKDIINKYNFDRGKDFYPLIMSYIISSHGVLELMSRVLIDIAQDVKIRPSESLSLAEKIQEQHLLKLKTGAKTALDKNLSLRSNFDSKNIDIDIEEITKELRENYNYLFQIGISAYPSRMLLISAYEIKKDVIWSKGNEKDELWEFLRHCRNAAAHNGKFYFEKDQPKNTARWGHIEIKREMEGKDLFSKDNPEEGCLSLADPIKLLWDIEQKFFLEPEELQVQV